MASSNDGDCAFEDDICSWNNPENRDRLDEINWERVEGRDDGRFPQSDHTTGTRDGSFSVVVITVYYQLFIVIHPKATTCPSPGTGFNELEIVACSSHPTSRGPTGPGA